MESFEFFLKLYCNILCQPNFASKNCYTFFLTVWQDLKLVVGPLKNCVSSFVTTLILKTEFGISTQTTTLSWMHLWLKSISIL